MENGEKEAELREIGNEIVESYASDAEAEIVSPAKYPST